MAGDLTLGIRARLRQRVRHLRSEAFELFSASRLEITSKGYDTNDR